MQYLKIMKHARTCPFRYRQENIIKDAPRLSEFQLHALLKNEIKWKITYLKRASKFSLWKRMHIATNVEGEYCWVTTYAMGGWGVVLRPIRLQYLEVWISSPLPFMDIYLII
jgi:hypothetical protein